VDQRSQGDEGTVSLAVGEKQQKADRCGKMGKEENAEEGFGDGAILGEAYSQGDGAHQEGFGEIQSACRQVSPSRIHTWPV
jgi:hypothetical protein